ncbi:MAG: hypothetical protein NVS9B3_14850 [Gemmatimonadaceae bacterium]
MPDGSPILSPTPVFEFDSAGQTIRRWAVPSDVELGDVIEGVVGDELITAYPEVKANIHLRFRPNGTYRVTAQPPPALEPEQWIEVGESTWVRVKPDIGMSQHGGSVRGVAPGRWIPRGDPGWYVRLDTVAGLPTTAHAITLNQPPTPRRLACPQSLEGYECRGYVDGTRLRKLAHPFPSS